MVQLTLMLIFIVGAILGPRFMKDQKKMVHGHDGPEEKVVSFAWARLLTRALCVVAALICIANTSLLWVGSDEVGHLKRIYLGKQMPPGRIIAMPDEMGPQARVLMPGFQFELFIRVTHDIDSKINISISSNQLSLQATLLIHSLQ